VDANPALAELLGYPSVQELLTVRVPDLYVDPGDRERLLEAVARDGLVRAFPTRLRRRDGREIWVEVNARAIPGPQGELRFLEGAVMDVTARRRAEEALRAAERRYRTLIEQIPAVTYVDVADPTGTTLFVSPQIERVFGVTPEEWKAADASLWADVIHPEDRDRVLAAYHRSLERRRPFRAEYRIVARDGRVRWIRDRGEFIPGGEAGPDLLQGVMFDVTADRQREEELRRSREEIRELLSRLVRAQEEERARIAADIHDDSIQVMTAVGMRIEAARRRASSPEEAASLGKLEETVAAAIRRLRRLLFELRPRALDEEGLAAALREQLQRLGEDWDVEWGVEDGLVEEPSPELRTVLFRVAQEALANARKHSRARRVWVELAERDGGVVLRVRDDGIGFRVDDVRAPVAGHLGLPSMRERAQMAGGWLRIDSNPGAGTTVEAWVPLRPEVDRPRFGRGSPR